MITLLLCHFLIACFLNLVFWKCSVQNLVNSKLTKRWAVYKDMKSELNFRVPEGPRGRQPSTAARKTPESSCRTGRDAPAFIVVTCPRLSSSFRGVLPVSAGLRQHQRPECETLQDQEAGQRRFLHHLPHPVHQPPAASLPLPQWVIRHGHFTAAHQYR